MGVFTAFIAVTAAIAGGISSFLWALGGGIAFTLVVAGLTYLIMGLIHSGKYEILFEMDDTGVLRLTAPRHNKKMRSLGVATVLVGRASGNRALIDAGRRETRAARSCTPVFLL